MPEIPTIHTLERQISQSVREFKEEHHEDAKAFMRLHPSCFAEGTSQRAWTSATFSSLDWDADKEPLCPTESVNVWDLRRSKGKCWEPLVLRKLEEGNLLVKARGKELAIACGYHCVVLNLGLEATVLEAPRSDYEELRAGDRPGPNEKKGKAKRLRSFTLPSHLVVPNSAPKEDRYMNILLAIILKDRVFLVVDFSRMVVMNFRSLHRHWNRNDFVPGSELWKKIWGQDRGPDWTYETEAALERLDTWRSNIILSASTGRRRSPPIVSTLLDDQSTFNGIGAHTAYDFLHSIAIHPACPTSEICANDVTYEVFRLGIVHFMSQWSSDRFHRLVSGRLNSSNFLDYNEKSGKNYIQSYVLVYRKNKVKISYENWRRMHALGLFDPLHVIGGDYVAPEPPAETKFKMIDVLLLQTLDDKKHYTTIRARCPDSWGYFPSTVSISKDVRTAGYSTTLGPAEFKNSKDNKLNISLNLPLPVGRPPKIKTGRRGRPPKRKLKKDIALEAQVVSNRKSKESALSSKKRVLGDSDMNGAQSTSSISEGTRSKKRKLQ